MKNDPIEIKAQFDCVCKETKQLIKKDERCIYYPICKSVFCMDSKQAEAYRSWKMDLLMGYNY